MADIAQSLSNLIRTAIVAPRGKILNIADLSAIEARVLAWGAGEQWRLDVFNTHGKIYEASASQMFSVPIEKIKKGNSEYALRQKGKIAELALGYLGGTGALKAMGALEMGLTEEELPDIVDLWRKANPAIMKFGYGMGDDAMEAVRTGAIIRRDKYAFGVRGPFLFMRLPSGRKLAYYKPEIHYDEMDRPQVTYMGVNQYTRKFERLSAWAGKWLENWDQATSRDILAVGLRRAALAALNIVGHVHDEILSEDDEKDTGALGRLVKAMSDPIDWAPGLPLAAAGYSTPFYRKD